MAIGEQGRAVAAITGASSGFGAIYAKRLAAEGCDCLKQLQQLRVIHV